MILMQGIYLAFQGCEKNILKTLLSGIDFSDYQFEVGLLEARKEFFLYPDWSYLENKKEMTSEQAKQTFLANDEGTEHIENLTLCVRNKAIRKKHIQTFKDLVEGHYDLALKVVGHNTVQIYSPKEEVLSKIMHNVAIIDPAYTAIKPYERIELTTIIG
jgi:hypothetical protein